jgi:hypothetical protein
MVFDDQMGCHFKRTNRSGTRYSAICEPKAQLHDSSRDKATADQCATLRRDEEHDSYEHCLLVMKWKLHSIAYGTPCGVVDKSH